MAVGQYSRNMADDSEPLSVIGICEDLGEMDELSQRLKRVLASTRESSSPTQWARDLVADCRRLDVAPFHKQWGSYHSNPLVVEKGMTIREAREIDAEGKGGGLIDGKLVRELPDRN